MCIRDSMYGERPVGMMKFIKAFLNNGDEWGDPDGWDGFDKNGYLKFEYTRNKYPLRFNYDPSKIKDDSEFDSTNQLDTFYEFPLKALSPDLEGNEEYKKDNPANLLDNPENLQKLGLTAVSYTHLDVYKRQPLVHCDCQKFPLRLIHHRVKVQVILLT